MGKKAKSSRKRRKAKTSRKGKKALRANISTVDIDHYFEKPTKDALSSGTLTELPSESLFYVDKSKDLSVKRKIEKRREKVFCESLLQMNSFVQPVPSSTHNRSKKSIKEAPAANDVVQGRLKEDGVLDSGMVDIWDVKGEHSRKLKKKSKPSIIPAIEVESSGCSFNPSFENHQDSLARAVVDEMQKIYRHKLRPEPVPLTVPVKVVDEEDAYFIEPDNGSDDDEQNIQNTDENEDYKKRSSIYKKVTRVEQNKKFRRKEQLRTEAEAMKVKQFSKKMDFLPDVIQEIAIDDEEKQRRHLHRMVAKQEGLKSCPPRLGKHKTEFNEVGDVGPSKSCTVPHPKNKKKRRFLSREQDVSMQEFIELQRAYFKDVDEFELAEEEITETELDNEEENTCFLITMTY